MSESADENEPVRIPDHDLDDLVSMVSGLVAETRKQGETLARLTDERPSPQDGEEEEPGRATASGSGGGDGEAEAGSVFILALAGTAYAKELAALKVWVDDLLLPVYGREITSTRPWCPRWTEHPESVARLHALWLAWQQFTDTEAGLAGPALWHRDHLDPTLLQLRAPDGPFSACTTSPARPNHRLLSAPDPAAYGQAA
ncbi:DUF4913 domain-containing protein [Streptomyces iranensis]|uniref:DUF4913 domain-containing protein n=1 Tax=Streptomyces iranensis TaxID=576784 RepID=A0A061A4V4_9ACTN|nr:DUF4913 domain-containing protein [Streptomyces iranensis]MBP2059577.1 hypothetical protein [Streptomyces iranensis]CDR10523.1 predicted protein [Streptomyces iranensis]